MSGPNLNFILLYVNDPLVSCSFYERLLNLQPVEKTPTFVMFALPNGIMLGLWSHKTLEPPATAPAGGSELGFSDENVDDTYAKWKEMGIPMVQTPTEMDFGRTFVALDPDGHRIRVFRLNEVHA
jgi:predicted enzyme related to lactoylglutathione lyase